jgi:hypothetical protein
MSVNDEGNKTTRNSRYKLDGKEYPYGKGRISAKKTGERQGSATIKLDGGNSYTQQTVISADGKTRDDHHERKERARPSDEQHGRLRATVIIPSRAGGRRTGGAVLGGRFPYKASGDTIALQETGRAFQSRYRDSSWATKASVWAG